MMRPQKLQQLERLFLSSSSAQVIDTGRVVVREKDPARERRRISRQREKRATLILGLIMGAFIACWLPFFFLYLLAPVCPSCNIQPWGFAFAFWLGYINSALNPVSHCRIIWIKTIVWKIGAKFYLFPFSPGHLYHFQQRLPESVSTHHLPLHDCPLLSQEKGSNRPATKEELEHISSTRSNLISIWIFEDGRYGPATLDLHFLEQNPNPILYT